MIVQEHLARAPRADSIWQRSFGLLAAVAMTQLRLASRYPGYLLIDILTPIVFAAIPILLGRSLSGPLDSQTFAANVGTPSYVAYMLIGSNMFVVVTSALWNVGFWVRREQQTGTLEAIYLAPASRFWVLAGVSCYGTVRSLVSLVLSFLIGCAIFQVNPLQGNIGLAFCFLLLGCVPIYGLSLLYGAVVLSVKEAGALIQLAQWVVSLLMGIYFPISVFPPLLRSIALTFPPTWMNNGVRAALLDLGWFFGSWYRDLGMLGLFAVLMPMLGYRLFSAAERRMQRREGMGLF